MKDIKKYSPLFFTQGSGKVELKEFSNSEQTISQTMLISQPPEHGMPDIFPLGPGS